MAECPSCEIPLVQQRTPSGVMYGCPGCHGKSVALAVLRNAGASHDFVKELWLQSARPELPRVRRCPHCGRPMAQATVPAGYLPLALDVCRLCGAIWFDPLEYESVPRTAPRPSP